MKPQRFVVGLTGGIGSGKSSALAEFKRMGAQTVSLDDVAHRQAQPGGVGFRAIVRTFGRQILGPDGRIDRRALGERVFQRPRLLRRLENITHPPILREMNRHLSRLKGVVVIDVPLLYEKKLANRFDATILVSCRRTRQISRVQKRDGMEMSSIQRRLDAQWPMRVKKQLADYILNNDGTLTMLRAQVRSVYEGFHLLYGGMSNGNTNKKHRPN